MWRPRDPVTEIVGVGVGAEVALVAACGESDFGPG